MNADASKLTTDSHAIDGALAQLKERAREFARLPPTTKAQLLRQCIAGLVSRAPGWVAAGARARASSDSEEWLAGPVVTVRMFRLLAASLDDIASNGRPPLGRAIRARNDSRLQISLFPTSMLDRVSFAGFSGTVLMANGLGHDDARTRQAAFYQQHQPEGGLSVILGAGNVSSIPPMDVATKMFVEGHVCILKMNPVNAWVGPFLERALAPLISRNYLRIVYGGADVGAALVGDPLVDAVHLTGSAQTHDLIVWGAPGEQRERRMAAGEPLLKNPITSELGNVSPVAIVPHEYSDDELWFMSRNIVTMVVNNASFNCHAAKMIVTAAGWPQRHRFLELIGRGLAAAPARKAYYPGAFDRYRSLLANHDDAERHGTGAERSGANPELLGQPGSSTLPWVLVRDLDPTDLEEPLFIVEPFCGESRPGESHPQALAELYVNVSAHTAPIIQPTAAGP